MEIIKKDGLKVLSLEDFIFLGSVKDTFDVFGQKITMQTLSIGFLKNVAIETSGLDMIARDYIWKIRILSHAIKSINGNSLLPEDPTANSSKESAIDEIVRIISKWEPFVVNEIYTKYEELMKIQKDFIDDIRKKYQKETLQS